MKSKKYHFVSTLLIYLGGGLLEMLVFCDSCFDQPYFLSSAFFIRHGYSGISWVALWKGSEFIVVWLDQLVPWLKSPLKRVFVSVVTIISYVYLVVYTLDLFFDLVFYNKSLSEALERTNAPVVNVIILTLLVNVVMHGRGFLLSWRQAAIDIERLKTEHVTTKYQSLKNQVNPHFLFNSLNALASLVYDDQGKAVEFIRKLSQVYRYVLDKKDEELVPLSEELAFAENFIFLQKIRFGDNLKVNIEKQDDFKGYLPPLAIQLLVENAIKHNVISEKHPLSIRISVDNKICVVANNIKEKLDKDSTGIGLNNLKERYKYLSKEELVIERNEGQFIVHLPILKLET